MAKDINSIGDCMKAVNILFEELKNAKRSLINSETCTVNRNLMQAQLEYLRENLPDSVEKAAKIVQEEETIRTETENKRAEILSAATAQAQGMVSEATEKAGKTIEQANYEANLMISARVDAANAEAKRIIDEAEKKASQLVEEESIVRRARVESDELREAARQEASELHKNTLDYMDSLLAETDRKLSELINNIRLERNEIRNHR